MTSWSIGALPGVSFKPSCSCTAVKIEGASSTEADGGEATGKDGGQAKPDGHGSVPPRRSVAPIRIAGSWLFRRSTLSFLKTLRGATIPHIAADYPALPETLQGCSGGQPRVVDSPHAAAPAQPTAVDAGAPVRRGSRDLLGAEWSSPWALITSSERRTCHAIYRPLSGWDSSYCARHVGAACRACRPEPAERHADPSSVGIYGPPTTAI